MKYGVCAAGVKVSLVTSLLALGAATGVHAAPPPPAALPPPSPPPAAVPAIPAVPAPAVTATGLVGVWTAKVNEFQKEEAGFLPDGRYYAITDVVGVLSRTTGRYAVKDGRLTFAARNGMTWSVPLAVQPDGTIRYRPASDDGPEAVFAKKPGSEQEMTPLGRKWDEQEAKDNAEWPNRLATAPLRAGRTPAVPNLAVDTGPEKVFEGATVFRDADTIYQRFEPASARPKGRVTGADPGLGRPQAQFHFFRNGRMIRRTIQYKPAASGGDTFTAVVADTWGRYKIDPAGAASPETIIIEFDNGEKPTVSLVDGRRTLSVGGVPHSNALWEVEVTRRLDEEQKARGGSQSPTRVPTAEEALKRKADEERRKAEGGKPGIGK